MKLNQKFKRKLLKERVWIRQECGLITPFLMIFFRVLQFFPPQVFWGNRTDNYHENLKGKTVKEKKTISKKNAKIVDIAIMTFVIFELIAPLLLLNKYAGWLITIILILRLIDIFQVNVNLLLFDNIRIFKNNKIASSNRSVSLIIINYVEIILIFGFFYLFCSECLYEFKNISDAYYFSTITQLTIGYGDLKPMSYLKNTCVLHGIISSIFLVLVIAKVISTIPQIKEENDK
ncbi:MAG TPA: potassium channel family protein [Prolixibacteraceae bacterium]|nr:potassium channel family protein [Prolixibacteraceae bacterium]